MVAPVTQKASRPSSRSGAATAIAVVSSITQCAAPARRNQPRGATEAGVQRRVALGGAVVALALTPVVPAGVQVVLAVVAVGLAGRPRARETAA